MIVIEGEKYACDACVKGHRVSSCHHKDRQLQHVNKKGRPVSQCQHCRGLRRSRAAHIKCVCAEHGLKEGCGDKANSGTGCQCSYGLPCTCAPKESLTVNTMPKVAAVNLSHRRAQSHSKLVAAKRSSEHILPAVQPQAGPSHRHNRSAHEFGHHPYKVRKFNASTGQLHLPTQRSSDSLPLYHVASQTQPSTPSLMISEPHESAAMSMEQGSPGVVAGMDMAFPNLNLSLMHSALSPHNPARYSMNDFSNFNWQGFSSNDLGDQSSAVSAMSEHGSYELSSAAGDSPYQYGSAQQSELHQRASTVSLEHPGLSHSPSASTSDVGDLAVSMPETTYPGSSMPYMTIDPSWMTKSSEDLTTSGLSMPPYQGVTHDLVFRPSQQPAATDDYFAAPAMNAAPSQTQADPYDEGQFLTPTHENGRYVAQPLMSAVNDYEGWNLHTSPPTHNFELHHHHQQHAHHQQQTAQPMYPTNGQAGQW